MEPLTTVARDAAGDVRALSPPAGPPPRERESERFEKKMLEASGWRNAIFISLLGYPQRLIGLLRCLTPVFRIWFPRYAIVLRYDEVREVLSKDKDFPVPWGWKMKEVTGGENRGGKNFVLGMPRDDEYRLSYTQLAEAFPPAEVPKRVARRAAKISEKILASKLREKEFDAIEDLITAVPTRLCKVYYGIEIPDEVLFAKWTLAISSYLFGPPLPIEKPKGAPPADAKLANAAAKGLRKVIRESIELAKQGQGAGIILPRLIKMQKKEATEKKKEDVQLTDDVIHAQLFGMVLGFIPTNVLAGGNMLETLLLRPEFMERARAAARADDDDLLWRCLREALRFRHINPGPWRVCPAGYTIGYGGPRPIRIPPGCSVLASTQSAMFDSRRIERPHVFDPHRRDEDYMVFGVGQHWCLGAYIAIAQITQTFKPLLKLKVLKPAGGGSARMARFSVFPLHLRVSIER